MTATQTLRVRELAALEEQHDAAALLARVWGASVLRPQIDPGLIRAFAHTGNYVAGAYAGAELAGVAVGFLAGDGHLHSHMTGVLPAYRGLDAAFLLKQHQRSWALERRIGEIRWTCDPLVGRNAYFNLHKLGAAVVSYLPDFYGPMEDGINRGSPSDRLAVSWRLGSPRAVAAAAGDPAPVPDALLQRATVAVARVREEPVALDMPGSGAPALLIAVPRDVEALRIADPELAARWRPVVREAMQAALAAGYTVTGISRDGHYVLEDRS
ncbi:GNAT family N-acetyltransferase [Actinomadura rubrisoli]|uniref:GNAT family N-acetyltransferase n=1 Tax=Actinomadura rubrisoli TaxID=2530368 RepID=A0A4R5BTJ5_9ACTN|nr:GNAT family N-acetyltransferase [Actinomadura rubrisoli]